MRFMLAFPNADELIMFNRVSYKSAFIDSKRWLKLVADPEYQGETRAHLFIVNGDHFVYVRTLWVQKEDVKREEIDKYLRMNAVGLFEGVNNG